MAQCCADHGVDQRAAVAADRQVSFHIDHRRDRRVICRRERSRDPAGRERRTEPRQPAAGCGTERPARLDDRQLPTERRQPGTRHPRRSSLEERSSHRRAGSLATGGGGHGGEPDPFSCPPSCDRAQHGRHDDRDGDDHRNDPPVAVTRRLCGIGRSGRPFDDAERRLLEQACEQDSHDRHHDQHTQTCDLATQLRDRAAGDLDAPCGRRRP